MNKRMKLEPGHIQGCPHVIQTAEHNIPKIVDLLPSAHVAFLVCFMQVHQYDAILPVSSVAGLDLAGHCILLGPHWLLWDVLASRLVWGAHSLTACMSRGTTALTIGLV